MPAPTEIADFVSCLIAGALNQQHSPAQLDYDERMKRRDARRLSEGWTQEQVNRGSRYVKLSQALARLGRNEGVRKMVTAKREAVVGSPDLETLTTSHIERAFLTVRQELKRFQRKGLGYSKDLETHKHAVALHFGVYNFVRKHHSLGTTPAVAAGIEEKAWGLERVVDITVAYFERKRIAAKELMNMGSL